LRTSLAFEAVRPYEEGPVAKNRKKRPQGQGPRPSRPTDGAARAERRAEKQRQAAAEQQRLRRRMLLRRGAIGLAALLVVVGATSVLVSRLRADQRLRAELTSGTCRYDRRTDPGSTNEHASNVSFAVNPPAGGIHLPSAAAPGSFVGKPPPDGEAVHALEHGDIAIWFRPEIAGAELDALLAVADRYREDVLVIPRTDMPTPLAATAWHRRLLCDAPEPAAIERFVRAYRDRGPEKVPEQ